MRRHAVVLSAPGTGPFVQQTARALQEGDLLHQYVTSFSYWPDSVSGQLLRALLRVRSRDPDRELRRRYISEVPRELVTNYGSAEVLRTLAARAGFPRLKDLIWERGEHHFDRLVARRHLEGTDAVYAYEHGALATFRRQKERNAACILEMPSPHHCVTQAILDAETAEYPELQTAEYARGRKLAPPRDARRDVELGLADLVVVNSSFSKRGLVSAGVPEDRIAVIPLGAPPIVERHSQDCDGPTVFIMAGQQSVRKGTQYVLRAWRRLAHGKQIELWLVGERQLPNRLYSSLPDSVRLVPTVSRPELSRLYQRAAVLLAPSLSDGFGMVNTEAMAHGLPVITTPNVGSSELVCDGENGLIVPARDEDALFEALEWCIAHPSQVRAMGQRAQETAAGWQWADYRKALRERVGTFLDERVNTCGSC